MLSVRRRRRGGLQGFEASSFRSRLLNPWFEVSLDLGPS